MIDYQPLYNALVDAKAEAWAEILPQQLERGFDLTKHGNLAEWQALVDSVPELPTAQRVLDADAVQIGCANDLALIAKTQLESQLKALHPWRKGPYNLFDINIDTEWRSDWKWNRLKNHIAPLEHRLVLDVGCGNGYHCWRMLGAGAKTVVGIDPMMLNVMQFQLVRKLYGEAPVYVLPMGIEDMPYGLKAFDTVFSMGVLYHRRSPIDHLMELRDCLQSGGELVLETLVIDGGLGQVLLPEDRYARMRNVWFLPSCHTLIGWLTRCGFKNIRLVDVTVTSIEEQRTTEWMTFHSLKDFLDAENPQLTCEGLPAPKRAIVIANAA
ncbi:tRNA 5-methoxyuridine(34)/uridine 5-oxyacetic acid(34) synthase CmoB [Methylobacter sp.]|uniref:tRNA 5-methoxyuridine(34)/uridine 5-oxyacetic acid(34) synthase CmoB n=1 Tax=Methylobacter sp. TaxID=2051955 RepID=UPI00248A3128|nr:tRNA 5-methoxyuridine(34)/uridine 5-oxyacetic acid(34) synthase CmoB [Methylobacter sp.]MDI1278317.1 tRNA 5-methoxyuridine(34)/uridine 5-oxyacetic acid(34) synthase CmoB [Methylobacter sp.]MDI1359061.1 tRNA 5-methoxyuridine(34)/uridine 5-oxyacetic acid(34) synthase CmoB [Methylobacter sp.]